MDKLRLAALGERLKTGGERLKTGGAQISRTIGDKMKEILQGPTKESKMVDEATSDHLEEPNWGLNLRICGMLNGDQLSSLELVRAIKKKISSNNSHGQSLSLDLLEICAMNCDKVFSAIASEKLLEELVRLIDNPQTHYSIRQKSVQLIRAWGESDDLAYLPVFLQTYMSLKAREVPPFIQEDAHLEPLCSLLESEPNQQPLHVPEGYPYPNMDHLHVEQQNFPYHSFSLSKEEKKECLVVTRNCVEILSSMLNPESEQKAVKDDLTESMLVKCKQSQPVIQQIIETAGDDEGMLFEALNLNDDLLNILSKYEATETTVSPVGQTPHSPGTSGGSSMQVATEKQETDKVIPSAGNSGETYTVDKSADDGVAPKKVE